MKADYDYDQLFPGRFMKSGEFKGREVTLAIRDVDLEEMEDRKGTKTKCIVSFRETKKQLVLNRTNGECLKGMFGRKVSDWVGKRVTFYPCTVEAFGAPTLAIRVRGSPDLKADKQITCKVGRQGDLSVTMKRTGPPASATAPAPVPSHGVPGPEVVLPTGKPKASFPMHDVLSGESEADAMARSASEPDPLTGEVPFGQ